MKKLLFIVVCCLCLVGCENKKEETISETKCTLNSMLDDFGINYYTWILKHDNSIIKEKQWLRSYEFETLSEAIEEETKYKKECEDKDYFCNITRNDTIVTYSISYTCEKNSFDDDDCNYLNEIKSLENNGFSCKDTK